MMFQDKPKHGASALYESVIVHITNWISHEYLLSSISGAVWAQPASDVIVRICRAPLKTLGNPAQIIVLFF